MKVMQISGPGQLDVIDGAYPARTRGHDNNPVPERDGFLQIMGNEDHGLLVLQPQIQQLLLQHNPRLRIKRTKRLIHDDQPRIERQRTYDIAPLTHPARKLMRIAVFKSGKPNYLQQFFASFSAFRFRHSPYFKRKFNILPQGAPRVKVIFLRDITDIQKLLPCRFAINQNLTRRRLVQADDKIEQCGFPASGGPNDRNELSVSDI